MITQIMLHSILVCPNVWDDIKHLQKKHKRSETKPNLELSEESTPEEKLRSIPLMNAIVTFMSNIAKEDEYGKIDQWGKQPYLDKGWQIWKVRYGFAGKGKSDGLRIVFVEHKEKGFLLVVLVKTKNECANEQSFQKEVVARIDDYFSE